jgi:hypothetical protein
MDNELLLCMPPRHLPTMLAGLDALARNGQRYPIPNYGLRNDARSGLGDSYRS